MDNLTNVKCGIGAYKFVGTKTPGFDVQIAPFSEDNYADISTIAEGMMMDPIFHTLLLNAEQLTPDYNTVVTGNLLRKRKTDFTLTSALWDELEYGFTGNWYLQSKDNTNEVIQTTTNLESNRGFIVRFFIYPNSKKGILSASITFGNYKLNVYGDGNSLLYNATSGVQLGSGYICNGYDPTKQSGLDLSAHQGSLIELLILPVRRNSIVFTSNKAGGWSYTDDSLSTSTDNVITTAAPVKFQFPFTKAYFQYMPLTYISTGSITITKIVPHEPDGILSMISSSCTPTGCTLTLDSAPVFEDFAVGAEAKRLTIVTTLASSTDNFYSPELYTLYYSWSSTATAEVSTESPLTEWRAESMVFTHDGTAENVSLEYTLDNEDLINEHAGKCNRVIKLYDSVTEGETPTSKEMFIGQTNMPKLQDPRAYELICSASSLWKKLQNSRIPKNMIYDGKDHTDIFLEECKAAGIPEERIYVYTAGGMDLPSFKVNHKRIKALETKSDNAVEFEAGTLRSEILTYINDTYIHWKITAQPINNVFSIVYAPLEAFPTTPVKYLYAKTDTALEITDKDTYWNEGFSLQPIEPEATFIRVLGLDEFDNVIIGEYCDTDAEDDTLTEAEKPENWVGERRLFGYKNDSLITETQVSWAVDDFRKRLTANRYIVEFVTEYDYRIWPYTLVQLESVGIVRIQTMKVNFDYLNDVNYYIPVQCVAELYVPGVN